MAPRAAAALLVVALAMAPVSCGSGGDEELPAVFAAASLTDVLPALAPEARYSFAGSDHLAFQIAEGAPADVFAAAGPDEVADLHRRGLVSRPRVFATNTMVVVVPSANPARIVRVADVARPGVRLVVGDVGVPVGDYARIALDRLELRDALGNVVSNEDDARSVVAKVALGEADAGLAYATDLRAAGGRVIAIPIPARAQPGVEYRVAVVTASAHPAEARRFVARLLSPEGRRALAARGFGLPRP